MLTQLKKLFSPNKTTDHTDASLAPIFIVSGLPRSGTSMMMKMLEAGGLPVLVDNIRTADDDNPRGYYELERVKQLDKGDTAWVDEAPGKVVKVIAALLEHLPSQHSYKVLFMRRHMEEILASQRKMLVRRGEEANAIPDAEMAGLFQKHVAAIEGWLNTQPNMSVLYVDYNDLLQTPQGYIPTINQFVGGMLDETKMHTIVDPDLYRNRS